MPLTLDTNETACVVRLEGDIDVTCAAEMKRMLIEAISSRKKLQVDLARAGDLDITVLQLLWAAVREAEKTATSLSVTGDVPGNVRGAIREAGFDDFLPPLMVSAVLASAVLASAVQPASTAPPVDSE